VDSSRYRGKWDIRFLGWLLQMQNLLSKRHELPYNNVPIDTKKAANSSVSELIHPEKGTEKGKK